MAATTNRRDLVNRALDILGVTQTGQPHNDEDYDIVNGLVGPVISRLSSLDITTIPDADNVPEDQFIDVAVLVADAAKQAFGIAALPLDDPKMAMRNLIVITSVDASTETLEVEDFDDNTTTEVEVPKTIYGEYF